MRDLKCAMKVCVYNKGYCCCADEIKVATNSECHTYTVDEGKKADKMFEIGMDEIKPDYSVDTKIDCIAPCIFQKNDKCHAVGITVLAADENAECATFILK